MRPPIPPLPEATVEHVIEIKGLRLPRWRRFRSAWSYHELLVLLATLCIGLLAIDVAAWLALFTMLEGRR